MLVSVIFFPSKVHELKHVRNLVSQITSKGAKLYDLLGKEVELGVRKKYKYNELKHVRLEII